MRTITREILETVADRVEQAIANGGDVHTIKLELNGMQGKVNLIMESAATDANDLRDDVWEEELG